MVLNSEIAFVGDTSVRNWTVSWGQFAASVHDSISDKRKALMLKQEDIGEPEHFEVHDGVVPEMEMRKAGDSAEQGGSRR